MLDARTTLELLVPAHPGAVSPLRLLLRTGGRVRPFQPHPAQVWQRIVRPVSGGPAIVSLRLRRPTSDNRPRR